MNLKSFGFMAFCSLVFSTYAGAASCTLQVPSDLNEPLVFYRVLWTIESDFTKVRWVLVKKDLSSALEITAEQNKDLDFLRGHEGEYSLGISRPDPVNPSELLHVSSSTIDTSKEHFRIMGSEVIGQVSEPALFGLIFTDYARGLYVSCNR